MNDTQAQKRHMGTDDEQKMREDMDRVNESGKPIPKHLYEKEGMLWSETLQMYVSIPND